MGAQAEVSIDFFPGSAFRYLDREAIVCLDVMCTTTVLVTALAQGRRACLAADPAEAAGLAHELGESLRAADVTRGGPAGVDLPISPAGLVASPHTRRPLVVTHGSTARLMRNASGGPRVYVACFRNLTATAAVMARRHRSVAVLAAGDGSRLRCEDMMAVSWLAERFANRAEVAPDEHASRMISRWSRADITLARLGDSAERLRRQGRALDIEFVVGHVDDLDTVCLYDQGEIRVLPEPLRAVG